jgi:hypothetical protein
MTTINRDARIAGFIYLLLAVAAPLRLVYIPSKLFVTGDAGATMANIVAHETLFRLGIAADLFCGTILLFVTLAFYRLFKDVDRRLAILVVLLGGVMPGTIYFFNVLNDFAVLVLAQGADFLAPFDKPQREALAKLFLRLHGQEILAAEIFWGLWLFPLAMLVYRSRFLPRLLAVWLIVNGIAYLAQSFCGVLLPQYEDWLADIAFPAELGEIAFLLWLLLMGARVRPAPVRVR